MKKTRIAAIVALVLMLSVISGACAASGAGSATPGTGSATPGTGSAAPGAVSATPKADPETPGTDTAAPQAKEGEVECDWLLKVDMTIPEEDGPLTVNHTLVLIARKKGGTSVYGTYEGAAYAGSKLDASNLSKELVKVSGGFDIDLFANNRSFEVVPYDQEKYIAFGSTGGASPAPLVTYESMALLTPDMIGGIVLNPNVESSVGPQGGYFDQADVKATPVDIKFAIYSGKVHVKVPVLADVIFEGTVVGDPKLGDEEYRQTAEKIEELIR